MEQRIINIYENYLKTKYDKKNKTIKLYSSARPGLCIQDNNYTIYLFENNHFNIYKNNKNISCNKIYKIYKIHKNNYLYYTNIKDNIIIYMDNIKYNYCSLGKLIEFIKLYKNNKLIQKNIAYDTYNIYKQKYLYIYKYIYIFKFYVNFNIIIISLRKNNIYFHIEYIII